MVAAAGQRRQPAIAARLLSLQEDGVLGLPRGLIAPATSGQEGEMAAPDPARRRRGRALRRPPGAPHVAPDLMRELRRAPRWATVAARVRRGAGRTPAGMWVPDRRVSTVAVPARPRRAIARAGLIDLLLPDAAVEQQPAVRVTGR